MLDFLPGPIKGIIASVFFVLNTIFWCSLLYPFAFMKVLIPLPGFRNWCTRVMIHIGENWITGNTLSMAIIHKIRWQVEGLEKLKFDRSYLVSANHQAWFDIVVLQHIFNKQIPFLRFFLKQQLIFVPLLGGAWWALDFPFMKRHSKSYLEKHPEKRGEDLATTRRACERFQGTRISVLNFLEGTRFTQAKHDQQKSPYKHLLKPKTGGIAFVMEAMGTQFHSFLDVTIYYPGKAQNMWAVFSGKLDEVKVKVEEIMIPPELLQGSYLEDPVFRDKMQKWVHELWLKKDRTLSEFAEYEPPAR